MMTLQLVSWGFTRSLDVLTEVWVYCYCLLFICLFTFRTFLYFNSKVYKRLIKKVPMGKNHKNKTKIIKPSHFMRNLPCRFTAGLSKVLRNKKNRVSPRAYLISIVQSTWMWPLTVNYGSGSYSKKKLYLINASFF